MCNFIEYKGVFLLHHEAFHVLLIGLIATHALPATDSKVVYRRYASLFFVMGIGSSDNELVALEIIHRYVELLDKYFGNVGLACLCRTWVPY